MIDIVIRKLKIIIKESGLHQKKIAKILGINEIHLSKVMNGKASLTQKMAHNLANIDELNTTEQNILYPIVKKSKKTTKCVFDKIKKSRFYGYLIY